jgi:hypothetical protein
MDGIALDRLDIKQIAAVQEALHVLEDQHCIMVRTITFDVYEAHRVRATRRGRWAALAITKIVRLP